MSPNNPALVGAFHPAQEPRHRRHGDVANGRYLYVVLEGATVADGDAAPTRRLCSSTTRVPVSSPAVSGITASRSPSHFIADVHATDSHRLLLIERDGVQRERAVPQGLRGRPAQPGRRRRLPAEAAGLDLGRHPGPGPRLAAADPRGRRRPRRSVPGGLRVRGGAPGASPAARLLVGCDNNFPNTGRNPGLADDNEFIVVEVSGPSDRR